ncbi:MAG: efflux RND transporter permease subunit [Treponema sp.]|jgi:HAE1 family hydrophobic/amphiphilic exporter-1|nr:efflux RND transporter permease subunit [Treponema sp.]
MSVAEKVVSRPILGLVVFGLVAIVALYLVSDVAIDLFPETSMPVIMVSTSYSGAGPETVEKSVTRLLESALVNISGLIDMTSTSSEGSSTISLEFDYGTDLDAKTNDIRDKIDRVRGRLPDEADSPQIMQFDPNSMPILRIAVKGNNRTQDELRSIAEELLQDRLEQIDGVASTDVMGGRSKIVKVEVSQNRLEAFGLTITGIAGSLASQNLELGAGVIEDNAKNYSIRTTGEFTHITDIADTVIAHRNGVDIRLTDIASVSFGFEDENSTVFINGETGVYVSVTKQSGTNSAAVAEKVYTRLDEIKLALPSDISLEITQDNTTMIRDMINELVNSALLGALLAMAVLFLFLRTIKSTIIIGISIPFSILVTLLVMSLVDLTLNMLTMAGLILGVGMIVDSSIVILENIYKYRERGTKPDVAAILGTHEVMSSIVSSTLTTICVFMPIFLFKNQLGMQGELFEGMIITVGIALVSSLATAIFLIPILASKYLVLKTRAQAPLKNPILKKIDSAIEGGISSLSTGYRKLLNRAVNHRFGTLIIVAAAFIGSVLCLPKMGLTMMPPMNEDSVSLNVILPLGTTYEDTRAVMLQVQQFAIDEIKGAKNIIVNAGSSGRGFNNRSTNAGELSVTLDMDNPLADTSETVMAKLRAHFDDFPNATMSFGQGRARMMAGSSDIDLALKIDAIDVGFKAASAIADIIKQEVPELGEISIDLDEGLPQVEVVIDRKRAYNLGLSITGIANEIAASMNGVTATTFRYEGDEYDVAIQLREEDRAKLPDLERIFVSSSTGSLVPLSNFASLEKGSGPVNIKRENQSRIIHITGNLVSQNAENRADRVEEKIRQILAEQYILPEGMSISWEGQWGELQDTMKIYILILTLAVLLVFGVMAGQYESFKDPLINLCTIPLMLIGVVFIYLITGQNLSTFTMIGIVMLAGIVVNNGIVLVDYTNLLVGRGVPVREAVIDAGTSRLRPVLMTTLTTVLGLIPMAFFPGESAMMIQPIGLTVIGGLASSTLITLFFIPVIYSYINEHRGKKSRRHK